MDFQSLAEKYAPFVRRNFLPLALGFLGMIFLVYGLIMLISSSNSQNDIVLESTDESAQPKEEFIFIDVEGSVDKPGVYKLSSSSRIRDALIAAGGLSADADRNWVSRSLNLASKLTDGAKIYIPSQAESIKGVSTSISDSSGLISIQSLISINQSTENQLDNLPGIGPVTAQKIINNRPYQSIEELVSKKAVSQKVFDNIKEKITL